MDSGPLSFAAPSESGFWKVNVGTMPSVSILEISNQGSPVDTTGTCFYAGVKTSDHGVNLREDKAVPLPVGRISWVDCPQFCYHLPGSYRRATQPTGCAAIHQITRGHRTSRPASKYQHKSISQPQESSIGP